ncbi:MAG: hypothetical protein JNJ63_00465 [Hyphomonadaceae bacterium]|nr:hypothetical protein [Hyphomonadaceae bacterium]
MQSVNPLRPANAAEALATGTGDLILLRRARLITLEATTNVIDSNNAFLSDSEEQRDAAASLDLSATAQLRLGPRTAASVRLAAFQTRYEEFSGLDYAAATATVAVQTRRLALDWTAYYQHAELFEDPFSDRQLTQDRYHLRVGRALELGDWTIGGSVYAERIDADPEEYNNSAVGVEASVSRPVPRLPRLTAFAQAAYERRKYDSFFEGLVGSPRRDDNVSTTVGIAWSVSSNVQVIGGYSARTNRSSSDVNRYDAGSAFIGISARHRL